MLSTVVCHTTYLIQMLGILCQNSLDQHAQLELRSAEMMEVAEPAAALEVSSLVVTLPGTAWVEVGAMTIQAESQTAVEENASWALTCLNDELESEALIDVEKNLDEAKLEKFEMVGKVTRV